MNGRRSACPCEAIATFPRPFTLCWSTGACRWRNRALDSRDSHDARQLRSFGIYLNRIWRDTIPRNETRPTDQEICMLDTLKKEEFTSLDEDALTVDFRGERVAVSVVESRDLPPISPRQSPFAIILQGPPTLLLQQGIHALHHPTHGQLDLFIVPLSRSEASTRFEIIFN